LLLWFPLVPMLCVGMHPRRSASSCWTQSVPICSHAERRNEGSFAIYPCVRNEQMLGIAVLSPNLRWPLHEWGLRRICTGFSCGTWEKGGKRKQPREVSSGLRHNEIAAAFGLAMTGQGRAEVNVPIVFASAAKQSHRKIELSPFSESEKIFRMA
jgi:hypothetical protein